MFSKKIYTLFFELLFKNFEPKPLNKPSNIFTPGFSGESKINFSDNQILRTFLDPCCFTEAFLQLETPTGLKPWVNDSYQKHLMRDLSRFRAINKSKKTGISTTFAGESIYKTFTNAGRQIMFVSTGQRIAEELLGKWYDMVNTMPPMLLPKWKKQSVEVAVLMNNSRVMSLPSSDPGKIRGLGLRGSSTDVYLDEYAHVDKDEDLWVVVRDFQIMGGRITVNSTPKGKRGKYYNIIDPLQTVYRGLAPKNPKNVWSYHEIPFWQCPRLKNQETYLRAGTTDIDFKQEYCCLTRNNQIQCNTGLKNITQISTNDQVLTSTGRYEKVKGVQSHLTNKKILKIETSKHLQPLELTCDHKVYAFKKQTLIQRLMKKKPTTQLVEAHHLKVGDKLALFKPNLRALPIKNVTEIVYDGLVYDLQIENTHDFTTQNGVCKNCEFIDESLSFYPYEIIWPCQTINNWVGLDYKTTNFVQMGIDFGKSVSETIIVVAEKTGPMSWKTIYIEELPGVDYESQVETITMLFRAFQPSSVNIDGTGPGGQAMNDFLSKENRIGHYCNLYNLSSSVKENILIRLRILMQSKRIALPNKEAHGEVGRLAEKLETQLHGMMRTTTHSGTHTRYSGKETVGMDDMVFAVALAVYEEYEYNFNPMIETVKDETLEKLTRELDLNEEKFSFETGGDILW